MYCWGEVMYVLDDMTTLHQSTTALAPSDDFVSVWIKKAFLPTKLTTEIRMTLVRTFLLLISTHTTLSHYGYFYYKYTKFARSQPLPQSKCCIN